MVNRDFELARRAAACKHWRWMPGMLAKNVWSETRILGGQEERPVFLGIYHYGNGLMLHHSNMVPCDSFPQANTAHPFLPDLAELADPATVGCLLALVREAWGEPVAVWWPKDGGCCVGVGRMPVVVGRNWKAETEAEALVAALEAAP